MLLIKPLSYLFFVAAVAAQSAGSDPATQCLGTCFDTTISGGAASGCADTQTSNGIETCICTDQTFSSAVATCLSSTCPNQASGIAKNIISFCQSNGGGAASAPPSAGGSNGGLGGVSGSGGGNGKSGGGGGGSNPFGGAPATLVFSGAMNVAVVLVSLFFVL